MNKMMNRKASQSLVPGDVFTFKGERATFIGWFSKYPRDTRWGLYKTALVRNGDGKAVHWSLNMAGSVEIH